MINEENSFLINAKNSCSLTPQCYFQASVMNCGSITMKRFRPKWTAWNVHSFTDVLSGEEWRVKQQKHNRTSTMRVRVSARVCGGTRQQCLCCLPSRRLPPPPPLAPLSRSQQLIAALLMLTAEQRDSSPGAGLAFGWLSSGSVLLFTDCVALLDYFITL